MADRSNSTIEALTNCLDEWHEFRRSTVFYFKSKRKTTTVYFGLVPVQGETICTCGPYAIKCHEFCLKTVTKIQI